MGLRVTVVGCGAIGLASAALLHTLGHSVSIWSPRAASRQAFAGAGGKLTAEGVVQAEFAPHLPTDTVDADVILITIPANGAAELIDILAPAVRTGQVIWWTPVASASALLLHEAAKVRGVNVLSIASPTTVVTGRRTAPGHVRVATVRKRLDVAALPAARTAEALDIARKLFGERFDLLPDVLAASLAPINPVAHVPLMLANLTRAELGESWGVYRHMTPAVCRIIETLDAERLAVARAFGYALPSIHEHFVRSFDVAPGPLESIAREIVVLRSGGPDGPASLATRFIAEDAPYGLAFIQALGRSSGIATPVTDAALALAATLWGADTATRNPLIERLAPGGWTAARLRERAGG
ncbi:MAG: NAD/NADP octopine/nopaline dehydrogenase family protein [Betaproteobacteria bacterium]